MMDLQGKTENELKHIVLEYVAQNREKDRQICEKDRRIAELEELHRLKMATIYAPSSEQMEFLFQEIEALTAPEPEQKQEEIQVEAYSRKKNSKPRKNMSTAPADTPVCDVYHDEDVADSYVKDGIEYTRGEDKVIDKIAFIPRKVVVERHHYPQYRPAADVDDGHGNKIIIYKSPKVDGLAAAPSLVASVLVSKFDDHLPLYRQEEIFRREGFFITRQKLAAWVIKYYDVLQPLEHKLKQRVYGSNFLYKDETPVQVLDVKGPKGKPSDNGFMYITIGSTYDEKERKTQSLVVMDYIQGRVREVLFEDLKKYHYDNYIMTDGLKGYLTLSKHCVCWVHAVRKLKDILKANKQEVNARRLVTIIARIYKEDEKYRALLHAGEISTETFVAQRKEASLVHINEFFATMEDLRPRYSPSGPMGGAFSYIDTYKDYLTTYLDIAESTPSNNVCERVAKSFALSRKNWLFTQTIDGADASAFFFSLIETAKLAEISPSDYLEYVCTFGPYCTTDEHWEALLPWHIDLTRLEAMRENRYTAHIDRGRTSPYVFCGATR